MTIRLKITHDQPDNDRAIVVNTMEYGNLDSPPPCVASVELHPGQTGEFHVSDGQYLFVTELAGLVYGALEDAPEATGPVETKEYADGTVATGIDLPNQSPAEQEAEAPADIDDAPGVDDTPATADPE